MPLLSPAQRANGRPLVFAHRGGRALGPENTVPAFDAGLAAGADGLELDVHLSSDGEVVICHDPTLERTTDASGPIAARSAAELGAVNATQRFGVDLEHVWTGVRAGIPTLRDVLRRYDAVPMIIEIKAATPEAATAVVDVVREARAIDRVCIGSFSLAAQTEQDEIVFRENRVDQLRDDGVVVADDPRKERSAVSEPGDEIGPDFVLDCAVT